MEKINGVEFTLRYGTFIGGVEYEINSSDEIIIDSIDGVKMWQWAGDCGWNPLE